MCEKCPGLFNCQPHGCPIAMGRPMNLRVQPFQGIERRGSQPSGLPTDSGMTHPFKTAAARIPERSMGNRQAVSIE